MENRTEKSIRAPPGPREKQLQSGNLINLKHDATVTGMSRFSMEQALTEVTFLFFASSAVLKTRLCLNRDSPIRAIRAFLA